MGAFIGTYTFPNIIESLGGAGTYGGDTVCPQLTNVDADGVGSFLDRIRSGNRFRHHHSDIYPKHQAR